MEALIISTVSVALAEIGDKTQLLALVLAARFRKPWPIIAGIFIATIVNHGIAAEVGALASKLMSPELQRWVVGISFIAMAAWILVPDSDDDEAAQYRFGAFLTTLVAFFLVEIGDKTQVATIVLAAHYQPVWVVVMGTTIGMLLANVPVVIAGGMAADKLPLKAIRAVTAAIFAILGILVVVEPMIPFLN